MSLRLALAVVLCASLAWAGDDPAPEEEAPPAEECLAILGRGGDWEAVAEGFLARLPAGEVQAAAQAALPVTEQRDLLIGAASWLGRPDATGRRSAAPAKVLTERLKRKGLLGPARAALLEALGAVALGPDLQAVADQARSGPRDLATAACQGLAWSPEGAPLLVDLAVALHGEAVVSYTPPPPAPATEEGEEGEDGAAPEAPPPPPADTPPPFEARHRLTVVLDALGRLAASPRGRLLADTLRLRDDATLAVVRTLARVKDEAGVAAVQELGRAWALEGASPSLRVEGVRLLVATRLDEPEQFAALGKVEEPAVRAAVAAAIHELGLFSLLPWLVDALEDPAPEVVTAAHRALCAIARREAPPMKPVWAVWLRHEAPKLLQAAPPPSDE